MESSYLLSLLKHFDLACNLIVTGQVSPQLEKQLANGKDMYFLAKLAPH